jgi:hypothetical protein
MGRAKKRNRTPRELPTIGDLMQRPNLTIPETMRVMSLSRSAVDKHCDAGRLLWFREGQRRRVVTDSIRDYQRRAVAEQKDP